MAEQTGPFVGRADSQAAFESAARAARWPWLAAVVGTWRGELLGEPEAAAAARLYLSRATVASHVAHILAKLGFSARTQIASWVAGRRT